MLKSFLIGAVPVGLFIYGAMFHLTILVYVFFISAFLIVSYMLGETIRDSFEKELK